MQLSDIKEMNLQPMQHIEIRYGTEHNELESRCGWFLKVFELPEGMTEIPTEYKASYPIEPPFVEIAHSLEKNQCPRDVVQYVSHQIQWLRKLKPITKF